MRLKLTVCTVLFLCQMVVLAQPKTISPYIEAWKKTGKDQSYASQVFFDSLRLAKYDPAAKKRYWNDISQLHHYLDRHPDRRLGVRLMMFEIMAAREHGLGAKYYKVIDSVIKNAYPLNDSQLNAELYSIRADIPPSGETHLLYNLKAVEIQRSIGFSYFPYVHNRFFGISAVLFGQSNYAQCIAYGKEGLKTWNFDSVHRDPRVYIFQLDIIGASYRNLNKPDSARWYYNHIIASVSNDTDPWFTKLWTGISKGNIGRTYTGEGNFDAAAPLLNTYLQVSRECGDWLNIAIAQNALSTFYFKQKKYNMAASFAAEALAAAKEHKLNTELISSAALLANIYRVQRNIDSAFYYYELENQYKQREEEELKKSELSVVKAQIAFDNLQHSLILAQASVSREKSLRNAILVTILLLIIIVLLLYNKKRTRDQTRLREARDQHARAEQQVADARDRIAVFTRHLIDKNNLIDSLRIQLDQSKDLTHEVTEKLLAEPLLTEAGWENFRQEFSKAYPVFFQQLRERCEGLTPAMERLAALIFLQLNNYQIANALGIGKESVARSKRRLRTILKLAADESLEDHVKTLATRS
ncbi:helix-turn-helix transcriptional regulator [Niabella sp. 22666]|uniref:helix-turn-helix transcriptional regulator n=1 Tax=Niabella sp. 22666 TaxID=3453954 RepID=UPI003F867585